MKISDGQTAYTGKRNRTSNIEGTQNSVKQPLNKQNRNMSYSHKKRAKWM